PLLRELVEHGDDGCIYLSPAGLLLYRAAQERSSGPAPVSWPSPSPLLPEQKNKFEDEAHHRPKGWERIVDKLCAVTYVAQVGYLDSARGGERVKILDPESGTIAVLYGGPDQWIRIRVETTAKGLEQTRLVADYIR